MSTRNRHRYGTHLGAHVDRKVHETARIRYRGRHEGICSAVLVPGVGDQGLGVEEDVEVEGVGVGEGAEMLCAVEEGDAGGEYPDRGDAGWEVEADGGEAAWALGLQIGGEEERHAAVAEAQKMRSAFKDPPMHPSTSAKLPALDLTPQPLRPRPRSSSIVKVEEVKDRAAEDALDRNAYLNINADWVNAKGAPVLQPSPSLLTSCRRMVDTCRPHHLG